MTTVVGLAWVALLGVASFTSGCVHPQEQRETLAARPAFSGCRAVAPEAPSVGWQACWRGQELTITNSYSPKTPQVILADELVKLIARHRVYVGQQPVSHVAVALAAPVLASDWSIGTEPRIEIHVQLVGRGEALSASYPLDPAQWPLTVEDLTVRGAIKDTAQPYRAKTISVLFHDGIEKTEKEAVIARAGLAAKDFSSNPLAVSVPLLAEKGAARSLGVTYSAWIASAGVIPSPDAEQFRLALFSE